MKEITMEKMQELMNNPEFAAKLRSAKTAAEMVTVFAENDIQITEEELKETCKQTVEILNEKGLMDGDELTEDGLELVTGGARWGAAMGGVFIQGAGIAIGTICPLAGVIILGCGTVSALCSIATR